MSVEQELIPGLPYELGESCLLRVDYTRINVFASVCHAWKRVFQSLDFFAQRLVTGVAQSFYAFLLVDRILDGAALVQINYIALFDPKSGEWSRLPHVPYKRTSPHEEYDLVQAGHRLVGIEMWSSARKGPTVYVYDLAARKWRKGAPAPIRFWRIAAYSSDGVGKVFLAGGIRRIDHDICLEPVRSAASYDVDNDTWEFLPDLAEDRNTCRGFFHDGFFHVLGGIGKEGGAERYDVYTGEWTSLPECAPAHTSHEIGRMAFLAPDGNYYRHHVGGAKLMRRQDHGGWVFVGNLPAEVRDRNYWVPFAWEEGFVMARKSDDPRTVNILYILPLKADHNRNIPCKALKMPSDYKGTIISGSLLKV